MTRSIHFNNHVSSKQDTDKFARRLFDLIVQSGERDITMSIDDGDGDIWKYEIYIDVSRIPQIKQLKEN